MVQRDLQAGHRQGQYDSATNHTHRTLQPERTRPTSRPSARSVR
jgi:hypothetical protein